VYTVRNNVVRLCMQFTELSFSGLRDSLLLFVHDQTDDNILRLLTSASQLTEGVLVEVVLSGNYSRQRESTPPPGGAFEEFV